MRLQNMKLQYLQVRTKQLNIFIYDSAEVCKKAKLPKSIFAQ